MEVCIVGLGAIGSFVAEKVAELGHGLLLVDRDYVEQKNLANQNYGMLDVGMTKANAMVRRFAPGKARALSIEITPKTINQLGIPDVIIGLTDNLQSRLLINDYAKMNQITWVSGAAARSSGQIYVTKGGFPCYGCIFNKKTGEGCEAGIDQGFGMLFSQAIYEEFLAAQDNNYVPELVTCTKSGCTKIKVSNKMTCPACEGTYSHYYTSTYRQGPCGDGVFQFIAPNIYNTVEGRRFPGVVHSGDLVFFEDGRVMVKASTLANAKKKLNSHIHGLRP